MQLYIQKREYTILEENTEDPAETSLLSAPKVSDGGNAARETLQNCLKLRLSKTGFISTFETQLDRFLDRTDSLEEFLCLTLRKARKLNKAPPTHLIGIELLDVIYQTRKTGAKFLVFNRPQPWSHLSEEDSPLVLFCRGAGQAIVPAIPESPYPPWRQVPSGQNLLVTTVRVVRNYLERRGGRILSFKLLWEFADSLIQSHTTDQRQQIKHTQTLRLFNPSKSMLRDFSKYPQKTPEPMLSNMVDGGLIFREPKLEKPCTLRVEASLTINVQQIVQVHTVAAETQGIAQQVSDNPTVAVPMLAEHQNSSVDLSLQNMASRTLDSGVLAQAES